MSAECDKNSPLYDPILKVEHCPPFGTSKCDHCRKTDGIRWSYPNYPSQMHASWTCGECADAARLQWEGWSKLGDPRKMNRCASCGEVKLRVDGFRMTKEGWAYDCMECESATLFQECQECGENKSVGEFWPMTYGWASTCKECSEKRKEEKRVKRLQKRVDVEEARSAAWVAKQLDKMASARAERKGHSQDSPTKLNNDLVAHIREAFQPGRDITPELAGGVIDERGVALGAAVDRVLRPNNYVEELAEIAQMGFSPERICLEGAFRNIYRALEWCQAYEQKCRPLPQSLRKLMAVEEEVQNLLEEAERAETVGKPELADESQVGGDEQDLEQLLALVKA